MRIPRAVLGLLLLTAASCAPLPPEEACAAICADLERCGVSIKGSSVSAGSMCRTQCRDRIGARGSACHSSASSLGECFDTYTCDGLEVGCSDEAASFADDCG